MLTGVILAEKFVHWPNEPSSARENEAVFRYVLPVRPLVRHSLRTYSNKMKRQIKKEEDTGP